MQETTDTPPSGQVVVPERSDVDTTLSATAPSTAPVDWEGAATRPMAIVARRRLGDSGRSVYPLALGGSVFGWTADDETSTAVLDRYEELGGDFVDTADSYAGGRSEVIIGNWMRTRRNRDEITVATKIGRNPDNPGLGQVSIVRAVEASLTRLQTDRIDVLFFHDDDTTVHLEDSLATVEWLIESGKVRHLGASNFSADRLMEARILSSTGLPKFVALQSEYNLLHRHAFESAPLIVASAQELAVMPHSALAGGFLTGKYRGRDVPSGAGARGRKAVEHLGRRGVRVLSALDRIAADHGRQVTTIALAWLLAKRSVVAPVASASTPAQVSALMDAAGIRLTRGQMVELDRASEER